MDDRKTGQGGGGRPPVGSAAPGTGSSRSLPLSPYVAAVASVLVAGLFAETPLVDVPAGGPAGGVSLALPWSYLLLAPVCDTLDALTLLTVRQHLAVLAFVLLVHAMVRFGRARHGRRPPVRAFVAELVAVGFTLAGVGVVYVAGALVPRPMAALRIDDPAGLAVDFHSHTAASHDGRPGFGLEQNRRWHRDAGFHVAFVTDHGDVAEGAGEGDSTAWGKGTLLLAGREFVYEGQHLVDLRSEDGRPTAWIQTLPEDLNQVPAARSGRPGVQAIELVDAAPRGLAQMDRERVRILDLADSLGLTLVASSNNHGWGRTAAAWSVIRLPGWELLSPDEVRDALIDALRSGRPRAVRIVARRRLSEARSAGGLALTGPALVVHLVRTLTGPERFMWVAWILVGSAGLAFCGRLRHGRASSPVTGKMDAVPTRACGPTAR